MKKYKILALITITSLLTTSTQAFAASSSTAIASATTSNAIITSLTKTVSPVTDFDYTENTTDVTITGYHGTATDVVIPDTIDGLPVTKIGPKAFANNPNNALKTIDTNKVTTIQANAFQNVTTLESANMPEVTYLDSVSFTSCINLVNVSMPKVTRIYYNTFSSCTNLDHVDLPNVIAIETAAFNSTGIKYVNMPKVQTIGIGAFDNCPNLKSIIISKDVAQTGSNSFASAPIENVTMDYGTADISAVTINDWNTFANKLTGLDVSKVTGKYAENNQYIKDLTTGLIYSVTSAGATIVSYTGTTTDLTIPETFNGVPVVAIADSAFANNTTIVNLSMLQDIPIAREAFSNCTALKTVNMPNLTQTGYGQFTSCQKLTSVDLSNIKVINKNTFSSCNSLTDVKIPVATTILDYAFANCESLQSIDIPNVITIGTSAFIGCIKLNSVTAPLTETIGNSAFYSTTLLTNIDLPKVNKMENFAFANSGLVSIISPEVTIIGYSTFAGCTKLSNINIPKVSTIKNSTFSGCSSLKKIDLTNITEIGGSAFSDSGLTSIDLPKITSITSNAFNNCTSLKNITISSGLTSIGSFVFSNDPIISVTMDCGNAAISYVTNNDFDEFLNKLSGLNKDNVQEKIVKNETSSRTLPDLNGPIITLIGASEITIEMNTTYIDQGATAEDDSGANITVTTDNNVDTTKVGEYTVTYSAKDPSGNQAIPVKRIVKVVDSIAPVITLNGNNPMTLILGEPYVETGANVSDNLDENIEATITGAVDTNKVGAYTVTYNATDSSGNNATPVTRTINVIYKYSGVLSPLSNTNNNKNIFKAGSVIPVKFKLTNIKGKSISSANTKLYYAKITNNIVEKFTPANNIIPFITDNNFIYDPFSRQYIFTMSTFGLNKGTYVLRISLDDGQTYENVKITLK